MKKYNMFEHISRLRKFIVPIVIIFLLVLIYISYFENTSSVGFAYFKISSVIFEIVGIFLISTAGLRLNSLRAFLIELGKFSFSIYLLHMQVAGALNFIFSKFNIPIIFLKTVIVAIMMYIALIYFNFVLDRLNLLFLKRLIGLR